MIKQLLFAASALFALATTSQAQELGKLHYRVEGGVTLSKLTALGVHHNGDHGSPLTSFRLGGSLVMPFDNTIFAFTPGLYVIGRGERQKDIYSSADGTKGVKIQTYALQLPLDLSFRLATIEQKHRIFLNVGPYFAYGLSAKLTRGGDPINQKNTNLGTSVDLYKDNYFKRFDFGVGANLMYQYQRLYLRGGMEISVLGQVKKNAGTPLYFMAGTPRYVTSYVTLGYEF